MTGRAHPYGRPMPDWPTRRLVEWTWCTTHEAIADQPADQPDPACFAAQVARLLDVEQPAACQLVPLYVQARSVAVTGPARPQIVGAGDAGIREDRTDRPGTPSPAPTPFELTPGVFQLDPTRLDLGPSTPPDLLAAVIARAATCGTVIRCHVPTLDLLHRVTLTALDSQWQAVFTVHPDGDRADITIHPLDARRPS